jgi:phage/plasmid-associated DNA primase
LHTNHLPKVGTTDDGTWRRLLVIPFLAEIKDDIKNYADYLVTNAVGAILQWIVEGAMEYIANGFKAEIPECVRKAIDEYKSSNDWLHNFLDECCEVDKDYRQPSGELYLTYRVKSESNGEYVRSTTDFYTALTNAGYVKYRSKEGFFIHGLRLFNEVMPLLG